MIRISTIFIAACMALIAASLGMIGFYVLNLTLMQSGIAGASIFAILVLYQAIAIRMNQRSTASMQIADLSRGTADLARQVAEFGRRLHTLETRLASQDGNSRASVEPLSVELTELGAIVRQLAQSVATHDEALGAGAPRAGMVAESADDARRAESDRDAADAAGASVSISSETAAPKPPAASPQDDTIDSEAAREAAMAARVRDAINSNRLDLYLQPLVTLPQRKVRFYEAMSRLREESGAPIAATDFIAVAERAGLMPRIDHMVVFRCVQVLRRLQVKAKDVGLFCNLSRKTLGDAEVFGQCIDFLQANRALAPSLVVEFRQDALKNLVPVESEHLARLAELGFRLSLDHVTDLRLDPRELSELGVKFIKVPAKTLLEGAQPGLDIHPADLSDLLGRFGIDLVAERIEGEKSVVDLLDYDVRYGQGFLFAPPRPLRPDNAPGEPAPRAASGDTAKRSAGAA